MTPSSPADPEFQFSPPHRGHPIIWCMCVVPKRFNSRPRTEGILDFSRVAFRVLVFQFSPPHGGHLVHRYQRSRWRPVSILAPARRASILLARADFSDTFQFSPPHGGHRVRFFDDLFQLEVSILAPARRASMAQITWKNINVVSILAPARRASI